MNNNENAVTKDSIETQAFIQKTIGLLSDCTLEQLKIVRKEAIKVLLEKQSDQEVIKHLNELIDYMVVMQLKEE